MDHSKALLIDPLTESSAFETIKSGLEIQQRFRGESGDGIKLGGYRSTNNEYHKHRREEEIQKDYFEVLENKVKDFDHIFVFGPGTARKEFFNQLNENKVFSSKKLESEACDQMSDNQLRAEVRKHFNNDAVKA